MNAIIGIVELALREDMPDSIREHMLNSVLEKWIPKEKKTYPVNKE